jgi:hypothetical protein
MARSAAAMRRVKVGVRVGDRTWDVSGMVAVLGNDVEPNVGSAGRAGPMRTLLVVAIIEIQGADAK